MRDGVFSVPRVRRHARDEILEHGISSRPEEPRGDVSLVERSHGRRRVGERRALGPAPEEVAHLTEADGHALQSVFAHAERLDLRVAEAEGGRDPLPVRLLHLLRRRRAVFREDVAG